MIGRVHYAGNFDLYTSCHLVVLPHVRKTLVPVQVTCGNCVRALRALERKVERETRASAAALDARLAR